MKALFSKSATGNIRSKILDPKYNTAEIVLELNISPMEFAKLLEQFDEKEFEIEFKEIKKEIHQPTPAGVV